VFIFNLRYLRIDAKAALYRAMGLQLCRIVIAPTAAGHIALLRAG